MRLRELALLSIACTPARAPHTAPAQKSPENPFENASFYVSPDWQAEVMRAANGPDAELVKKAAKQPTAIWLDSIAKASTAKKYLDDARGALVVLVLYDLPNRACAAKSSAGELEGESGEARYEKELLDPLAATFAAHASQEIVVVVEPDSLANLATNASIARCAASDALYRRSIARAISKLSMPNVALYLDAAHAGWTGWDANREKIAAIFKDVLDMAGAEKIRGFATNVSNYDLVRAQDRASDNPCPDEIAYVEKLSASLARVGIAGKKFIIDTSRNGRASHAKSWCNVTGAGLGERPRASPAPLVDAFFWVKIPGESDGTSDPSAPRFDAACASPDSASPAPQAGEWFPAYFQDLARNASPPL